MLGTGSGRCYSSTNCNIMAAFCCHRKKVMVAASGGGENHRDALLSSLSVPKEGLFFGGGAFL